MQCIGNGSFEKKPIKLIHRQPSEIFVNDQKVMKIDLIWKEPIPQSSLEKLSWKTSVDCFSLKQVSVDEYCTEIGGASIKKPLSIGWKPIEIDFI